MTGQGAPVAEPAKKLVFVSYAREDASWRERVLTALKFLSKKYQYEVWTDKNIKPGREWNDEIGEKLTSASVALLLVSHNFLASDYIQHTELPLILDAASKSDLTVIWVMLSSCPFDESRLQRIQAAHDVKRPLDSLNEAELNDALTEISRSVTDAVCHSVQVENMELDDVTVSVRTTPSGQISKASSAEALNKAELLRRFIVADPTCGLPIGWKSFAGDEKSDYRRLLSTLRTKELDDCSAIQLLGLLDEPDDHREIRRFAQPDGDESTVITAIRALSPIWGIEHLKCIVRCAYSANQSIHAEACSAIAAIRDPKCFAALPILRLGVGIEVHTELDTSQLIAPELCEALEDIANVQKQVLAQKRDVKQRLKEEHNLKESNSEDYDESRANKWANTLRCITRRIQEVTASANSALSEILESDEFGFREEVMRPTLQRLFQSGDDDLSRSAAKQLLAQQDTTTLKWFRRMAATPELHRAATWALQHFHALHCMSLLREYSNYIPKELNELRDELRAVQTAFDRLPNNATEAIQKLSQTHRQLIKTVQRFDQKKKSLDDQLALIRGLKVAATTAIADSRHEENRGFLLQRLSGHEDDEISAIALRGLSHLPLNQDTWNAISHSFTLGGFKTRDEAAYVISTYSSAEDLEMLRIWENSENQELKKAALFAIARIGDPEDMRRVRELAFSRQVDDELRCVMITTISNCPEPTDWRELLHNAVDATQSGMVRVAAMKALPEVTIPVEQIPTAIAPLVDIITSEYLSWDDDEGDMEIPHQAINAIVALSPIPEVLDRIADNKEEDVTLRISAIRGIAARRDDADYDRLRRLALDTGALQEVREAAIEGLIEFEIKRDDCRHVLHSLIDVTDYEEDVGVRHAALSALIMLNDPRDIWLFCELHAIDDDESIGETARSAIIDFEGPNLLLRLQKIAEDGDARIRVVAAKALCERESDSSLENWLQKERSQMHLDVLFVLEEYLYAPEWWNSSHLRASLHEAHGYTNWLSR